MLHLLLSSLATYIQQQEHPGHVYFGTDAWTSLNHRAFVAWTVHLHHEGHVLCFLLDIIEVPEVCHVLSLIHPLT
jgi:hypothetical protein